MNFLIQIRKNSNVTVTKQQNTELCLETIVTGIYVINLPFIKKQLLFQKF